MTESAWAILIVNVVGFLTLLIKSIADSRKADREVKAAADKLDREVKAVLDAREQDRKDREEDRKDREQLAKLTVEQLAAVEQAGGERMKRIVKEVQDVKKVAIVGIRASKEALKEANNVNSKIEMLGQSLVEASTHPMQVEVMNTPENPVPVDSNVG